MADFSKELETINELLTKAYNNGRERGREDYHKSFNMGQAYRHKKLEEKGVFFDVGDRVRTLTFIDWDGISVFPCGTVGTIIEKHKSDTYGVMLYTIKSDGYEYTTYLYGAADLELVTPTEEKPVKVGSIVKIVKEYNDYCPSIHLFSKGTLGVITHIKEDCPEKGEGTYKYKIEANGVVYAYDRDGFEVVTRIEEDK
jgi:hypothetical protein